MLVLKNGNIINPAGDFNGKGDIVIDGGVIRKIGTATAEEETGSEVLDLDGKYVFPGFADIHVHLREPGEEYKETIRTGTMAAAAGGFTAVACMPNTKPAVDNDSIVRSVIEEAEKHGYCAVHPIACITKKREGRELTEMGILKQAGAAGLSDDGSDVADSGVMRRAMDYAKAFGYTIFSHAEDRQLAGDGVMNEGKVSTELGLPGIPGLSEEVMVARNIMLSELTGCPLHLCHMSTKKSCDIIRGAKERGVKVTAEVTPHHLMLNEEAVRGYDTMTKVNPPLRTEEDRRAMAAALRDGVIDCIVTDHAPHAPEEKEQEYIYAPFGISGLETSVPLAWKLVEEDLLTPEDIARVMSVRPYEILGLEGGVLSEGAAADVTVVDPELEKTIHVSEFYSLGHNTPFEGVKAKGWPVLTVYGGRVVMKEGKVADIGGSDFY